MLRQSASHIPACAPAIAIGVSNPIVRMVTGQAP
jgi:hypothetical protein